MLLVGYFEGIDSQRGIAWRCADSLSSASVSWAFRWTSTTPDHSTLTNTRKRLPPAVFAEVFQFVLRIAAGKRLLSGKTVGVDSTLLEADAAMKSIVRRDTGEDWKQYVTRLMREDGTVEPDQQPSDEEIRRYDQTPQEQAGEQPRTGCRPHDPESRIAKLKDGRTHTGLQGRTRGGSRRPIWLLAAEIRPADQRPTPKRWSTVCCRPSCILQAAGSETPIEEVVGRQGLSRRRSTLELCDRFGASERTFLSRAANTAHGGPTSHENSSTLSWPIVVV